MSLLRRSSLAFALALTVVGCSPPPPPPPDITVTATPDMLPGDGVAESRIEVSRPGTVDVTLRVGRGTFKETGRGSIVIEGGTGTATYVACDSLVVAGCSGALRINADSEDEAVGSTTITIGQREICNDGQDNDKNGQSDCADSFCLGKTCSAANADAGVRICDAAGACVCATGTVEDCTNGTDDNCDGKIDCADPTCDQKGCFVTTGVGGRCSMNACSCTAGAEICSDGMDNDCDGKIDCADTDCRASSTMLGKVCDASKGLTCSQPDSMGVSTCSVCPGGSGPEAAALCADGLDNDCDGTPDCFDTDCANRDCRSSFSDAGVGNGWKCDLASAANDKCACTGNGGTAEVTETTCNDGFDNDCDGRSDCGDADCLAGGGQVCGTFGKKCLALNTCGCGSTSELCATPEDDDCDGLTNCQETSCRPGTTGLGAVCDESGNTCSQVINATSTCNTCSGNGGLVEAAEGATGGAAITCGDGKDNDCDSTQAAPRVDCQDPDCSGKPCSATGGVCNGTTKSCGCPGGASNEQGLCNDGQDNDCDGRVDCADTDCQPSGTTPAGVCGAGNGRLCTAGGTCACSGNGGTAEVAESLCNDGRDNDCDGRADCADTKCQPVGNQPGRVCDSRGNTCSNLSDAGVSGCTVCSGNGGSPQSNEFSCGDGFDNDCDGLIDCQDTGCDTLSCNTTGRRCAAASLTCVCTGPEAMGETTCTDGQDNDCDGLADCADPNCQPVNGQTARACSSTGRFCTAGGACACNGNGGIAEANEGSTAGSATCGDGRDNDCDGLSDCLDPDCKAATVGTFGRDCSAGALAGARCDFAGACVCPGGQTTEATCNDGLDNDCDGQIDCADTNCASQRCTTANDGKRCTGTPQACSCPSGLTSEVPSGGNLLCANGTDDDCDGLADCLDPDCQGTPGRQCLATSTDWVCLASGGTFVCADQTAQFSLTLTSTPTVTPPSSTPNTIPADGTSTTTITATLRTNTGQPVANATVSFAITAGAGTLLSNSGVTNASGVTTVTFRAPSTQGTATITATYGSVTGATIINLPRLQQVKFISQQFSVMGVRSSSFREDNLLTFQLLDTNNQPYPPGLRVNFSHTQFGGSYVGSTPTCSGTPVVCTASATTDNAGFVSVYLHSGTLAAVVSVSAEATAGGGSANAAASNIAIVGAKANGLRVSLDCTPKNVPAFTNNNCTNSFFPANISCTVALGDRFNNVLGVSALVTFTSEAGAAGTPSTTPEYSPGNANLGKATGFVAVSGYSLPVDVAPFSGEHSLSRTTACGTRIVNPRDGLVTIIASANGEEGFVDTNSNGAYDTGESFLDQGEPFVDVNDNGVRDATEQFLDTDGDNAYDGPNGSWDANTVIWAEERVIYTGFTSVYSTVNGDEQSRFFTTGTPPLPTPSPFITVPANGSVPVGVRFMDQNFNYPTYNTAYAVQVVTPVSGVSATFSTPPSNFDTLGLTFSQQFCDSNNVCGNACVGSSSLSWCRRRTSVGPYGYGNGGVVTVTSSTNFTMGPTMMPAPLEVRANATFNGVTQPFSMYGSCQ